jgi:uncharacterized caspase-like protein
MTEKTMACHEIAALRLALMRILGRDDAAERQHELAELGTGAETPGPLRALCGAADLASLLRSYDAAIGALEEKLARTAADDPELPYLRTLLVLNRKVELELRHQVEGLAHLFRDLEAMHDFVHELYPAAAAETETEMEA